MLSWKNLENCWHLKRAIGLRCTIFWPRNFELLSLPVTNLIWVILSRYPSGNSTPGGCGLASQQPVGKPVTSTAPPPADQVKVYAVEGTPMEFSTATSLSDLTVDEPSQSGRISVDSNDGLIQHHIADNSAEPSQPSTTHRYFLYVTFDSFYWLSAADWILLQRLCKKNSTLFSKLHCKYSLFASKSIDVIFFNKKKLCKGSRLYLMKNSIRGPSVRTPQKKSRISLIFK